MSTKGAADLPKRQDGWETYSVQYISVGGVYDFAMLNHAYGAYSHAQQSFYFEVWNAQLTSAGTRSF